METNFRLYAYTSSDLQRSILQLFSKLEYQLPNLYVGTITRDSIGSALEGGLTAEVVISYLQVWVRYLVAMAAISVTPLAFGLRSGPRPSPGDQADSYRAGDCYRPNQAMGTGAHQSNVSLGSPVRRYRDGRVR